MILESPAFGEGVSVPRRHTCDGEDLSPPLCWREVPKGAVTLALVMDDPDAPGGTWVHWVVFNLPASTPELPEASSGSLRSGAVEGTNSWNRSGYGGPCPPSGTHRYVFRLYALDTSLDLDASATATDVTAASKEHVLAEARLMGTYARD